MADYTPEQTTTPNQELDRQFSLLVTTLGTVMRQVNDPRLGRAEEYDRNQLKECYYTTLVLTGEKDKPLPDDDEGSIRIICALVQTLRRKGFYQVGLLEAPV